MRSKRLAQKKEQETCGVTSDTWVKRAEIVMARFERSGSESRIRHRVWGSVFSESKEDLCVRTS